MIITDGLSTYQPTGLDHLQEGSASPFSEEMQRESRFVVRLLEATRSRPSLRTRPEDAAKAIALRILIIDGNCRIARGLSRLLRSRGHWVQYAHTGVAALKIARGFQPEFVLVEASLPDLSGFEVAALLPGVIGSGRMRVASVSGRRGEEDLCLSQAAGCVSHLRKPVELAEIEALLAEAGATTYSKSE